MRAFLGKWWSILLGVALIFSGGFFLGFNSGRGRSVGELARAKSEIDSLKLARGAVEVRYQVDTLRLREWLTRYERTTDTLWRDSIVYVRKEVADSTIKACLLALKDCDAIRAKNDTLVRKLEALAVPPEHLFSLGGRDWRFFEARGALGYEWSSRAPMARAGLNLNVSRHWGVTADIERRFAPADTARLFTGFEYRF